MHRQMTKRLSLVACALALALTSIPAQAEMYVAGQLGASLPNKFSNLEGVGSNTDFSMSDLSMKSSFMYGAKLGYYFDSMKWLGVETEIFNSTPHVKQQAVTVSGGGGSFTGDMTGLNVRVLNWAPLNIVVRHQMGQLEPYAGVGMGVFFARLKDGASGESTSSTAVGLNTQVGLRYLVTKNVSLFGEWKYNRAHFNFSESSGQNVGGFKGDYSANIFAFGVGYHF